MGYFETVCEMPSLQNRERTGVPARATRAGWWMRSDAKLNWQFDAVLLVRT